MPIATLESRAERMERANVVMGAKLDSYTGPVKRQPLREEQYEWEKARPNLVNPTVKANLEFVSHVEFAPELYAEPMLQAADREGAVWLTRFITETWLPEETQHGVVLRRAAIVYGAASEKDHDQCLAAIRGLDFTIGRGYTVGMAATYARDQELITNLYYTALMHRTEDPVLRKVFGDLAKQEMFHSMIDRWGMDFARPDEIVEATIAFKMPGHITSPELQKQSSGWAQELGFDFGRMRRTLATDLLDLTGYEGLGRVVTSPLIRDTYPPRVRVPLAVADRINNPRLNRFIGQYAANQVLPKAKAA